MSRTCLVHIYGTSNILAALSAVSWYGIYKKNDQPVKVITIINTPGLSSVVLKEIDRNIAEIIVPLGWFEPVVLSDQDIDQIMQPYTINGHYKRTISLFRNTLNLEEVDEVYYAHDVGSDVPSLAMNAYPNAKRITFGDALGSIYNTQLHLRLASGNPEVSEPIAVRKEIFPLLKKTLKMGIKKISDFSFGAPIIFQAETAVLILPMDQTGDCLNNKELIVVPKNHVLKIIHTCEKNLNSLTSYIKKLLVAGKGPYALVLLENISDGNFLTKDKEVALYEDLIRKKVPKHTTIFLKSHPLSVAPINEILAQRLEGDYQPILINNDFSRIPIELWSSLVQQCKVISISYSCITLSFLFGLEIEYPFTNQIIEQYFPDRYWDSYKNSDKLYRGQLKNLQTWDGQGILWKGSYYNGQ